jgi:hypothetical protein
LPAQYYNKVLYPLQNEVFPVFEGSPFYLTGGTALSRGYYNHRYSDDLDYFVNDHPDFPRISERQIERVGAIFTDMKIALRDINWRGPHAIIGKAGYLWMRFGDVLSAFASTRRKASSEYRKFVKAGLGQKKVVFSISSC